MPIRTQDAVEDPSKQSTIFLGNSATGLWAELAVDDSQYLQNVTAAASSMSEASPASDRFDISHPRTIGAVAEVNNTSTGMFFLRGGGATTLRFDINVAGTLRAVNNNATVGTVTIPGLGAGVATYVMAWASRANPLTTGASDAVQSWLYVVNVGTGALNRAEFTHPVMTSSATTARWGTYSNAVLALWHSSTGQSFTEVARDHGATSPSAPTTTCELEQPLLPLDVIAGFGDADELYGPIPQWAAFHVRRSNLRHWTPLANTRYRGVRQVQDNTAPGNPAYRLVPGSTDYYMNLGWLHAAPAPEGVTHAWVRIHVQSWVASGAAVPLGLLVVSMSRRPDAPGDGPLQVFQVGEIVTRDDTASGPGQWDINALVRVAIGDDGWTYLCPAYSIDPEDRSGNDANALLSIMAFHAVPCVSDVAGGA